MIYLDGHSTTPLDPQVFEAMKPYFLERFGNASHGLHRMNWEAEAAVEKSRTQLAELIGAHEKEIIFTSSATESNHLALLGIADFLKSIGRTKILSIKIEHASLLGALDLLVDRGLAVEWVATHPDGRIDLNDLEQKLSSDRLGKVGLVSVAFANHEIGTIQPVAEISKLAHAHGAYFHTDAVQALGKIRFNVNTFGIDLMTLSAHKIHGPKGTGALYLRRKNPRVEIEPIFLGGQQERGLRPGTPNTPAIVGFGEAASIAHAGLEAESKRISELRDLLWMQLQEKISGIIRNGSQENSLPNNLNVSIRDIDGAALFGRLTQVAVSNASACLNGPQDYSQVLSELGVEKDLARATLRFGIGRFNTREEIEIAAQEIADRVQELRQLEKDFAEQIGGNYPQSDNSSEGEEKE